MDAAAQTDVPTEGVTTMEAALHLLQVSKYIFSTFLTLAAIAFICYGIGSGQAVLPGPAPVHFAILVFVLVLLGYLEGLQVAILALEGEDGSAWKTTHPQAYRLHTLVATGKNVQRFLVGRQFYVVFVVFLCSQVTTFPTIGRPEAFPSVLWFVFVTTALPGALLVLAFGQLMPQLIASRHPVLFCNMLGSMQVLHITLFLESMGITHFTWLLAASVSRMFGLDMEETKSETKPATKSEQANEVLRGPALLKRLASIQGEWKRTAHNSLSKNDLWEVAMENSVATAPLCERFFVSPVKAGLEEAREVDMQRDGFAATPKANLFPTPAEIAAHLVSTGQEVPRFLLPPSHSMHVPPHILAYSLMSSMAGAGKPATEQVAGTEQFVLDV